MLSKASSDWVWRFRIQLSERCRDNGGDRRRECSWRVDWSVVANTDLLALRSSREALRNAESMPAKNCFAIKYENSTAKNFHAQTHN